MAKAAPSTDWAARAYYCIHMKNALLKSLLAVGWASGLLLAAPACKKVDDELKPKLPEATQEGNRTFGCLVNGTVWLPYNTNAGHFPYTDYDIRTNRFPIDASVLAIDIINFSQDNAGISKLTLSLRSTSALAPGVYTLSDGFSASATERTAGYSTAQAGTGSVTLTKVEPYTRTVNGITSRQSIVSGTFAFTAGGINGNDGKTLTVTEGRFDLRPEQ